jgi:hypothetical protein
MFPARRWSRRSCGSAGPAPWRKSCALQERGRSCGAILPRHRRLQEPAKTWRTFHEVSFDALGLGVLFANAVLVVRKPGLIPAAIAVLHSPEVNTVSHFRIVQADLMPHLRTFFLAQCTASAHEWLQKRANPS